MTTVRRGLPGRIGKFCYVVVLMAVLTYGAYGLYSINTSFWARFTSLSAKDTIFVVLASALLVLPLDWLDTRLKCLRRPWLEWSIFHRNINFAPMDYTPLRIPFLVLLYFNIPVLAWVEEMIFRDAWVIHSTAGWLDAVWRSIVFGVLHIAAGAKVRSALPLTFGGMWLSMHYLSSGITHATLAHSAMNVTGLTAMLVSWARTGKNPFAD